MEQIRTKELLMKIAKGDEPAFVFVKVKLQASVCKDFENASGWLIRITRNTALDFIRKKKKYAVGEELVKDKINRHAENSGAEYSIFMSELFDELKEEERQIVVLHLISDFTHKTIAKILELPLTTVKWRYRKAILHLEKISVKKEWEL